MSMVKYYAGMALGVMILLLVLPMMFACCPSKQAGNNEVVPKLGAPTDSYFGFPVVRYYTSDNGKTYEVHGDPGNYTNYRAAKRIVDFKGECFYLAFPASESRFREEHPQAWAALQQEPCQGVTPWEE